MKFVLHHARGNLGTMLTSSPRVRGVVGLNTDFSHVAKFAYKCDD